MSLRPYLRGSLTVLLVAYAAGQCIQLNNTATLAGITSIACANTVSIRPVTIPAGQTLPAANDNVVYSGRITVVGGVPPYTFTITSGALPSGIPTPASSSSAAVFAGTPTVAGVFLFTLQACDTLSNCASAPFSLTVNTAPVSIPSNQSCLNGTISTVYRGCTINAINGVTPYNWTVSSGTLPASLSLATVSNKGVISGTPSATGTSSFVLQVTDSASNTATIPLSITINSTSTCGYPTFNCARIDRTATSIVSTTVVPPQAGPNTCVAGSLQTCGNSIGINTLMTDPLYNNVQITRITDFKDNFVNGGPVDCKLGVTAGPGGSGEQVIWDNSSNYVEVDCNASHVKWFNPATGLLNTSVDSQGWVHSLSATGPIFSGQDMFFDYTVAGRVVSRNGTGFYRQTISSGIAGAGTQFIDFIYAYPCWNSTTRVTQPSGYCGDWSQQTWPAGSVILPLTNNALAHLFELTNGSPCISGSGYPAFNGGVASNENKFITDGACTWEDIGPTPIAGTTWKVAWVTPSDGSHDDTKYGLLMNNYKGQGAIGACFGAMFDTNTNTYYHLNTCTGQMYKTVCTGGSDYKCSGGTFTLTYTGVGIPPNRAYSLIHNARIGGSGIWMRLVEQNCAFVACNGSFPNTIFWNPSGNIVNIAADVTGFSVFGHGAMGFLHEMNQCCASDFKYFKSIDMTGATKPYLEFFDVSQGQACSPNPCAAGSNFDQHMSWVPNSTSADNTPVCMPTMIQAGGGNDWPSPFPWTKGELVCFATDGSNGIWRQGFMYNTGAAFQFPVWASVGGWSQDGAWYAMSTDWYCTLGNTSGGATTICGLPFQASHNYATLNEEVSPGTSNGPTGFVFKVTTTGTSAAKPPVWCKTVNCTVTSGTVTFTGVGAPNEFPGVFVFKMQ